MTTDDERQERAHDASYRALFSHPELVAALLRDFVGEEVTGPLELDRMERVQTTFISGTLLRRESDMLWRIPRGDASPLYLFIMIEFQSRIDPMMAVRMLVYVGLLYEHLYTQDTSIARSRGLPPILPIVLYNGSPRWSAQTSTRDMINVDPDARLSSYLPTLKYWLIDVGRLDRELLRHHNTILSNLFTIETLNDPELLRAQVKRLGEIVRSRVDDAIIQTILMWLSELLRAQKLLLTDQQISSFKETDPMLSEAMERWREKLRQEYLAKGIEQGIGQGIEQGRERARRELLGKMMQLKFGEDEGRAARIEALPTEAIDRALERLLDATDEASLFAP